LPKQTEPSPYHHGNLRQCIIDTACEHLKHTSPESLSCRAISRNIGVSQTAHYRHFPSKNALLAAIAIYSIELLHKAMNEANAKYTGEFAETFLEVGLAYVTWATSNPEKYQLLTGSSIAKMGQHKELMEARHQSFEILNKLIEQGIDSGFFIQRPIPELAGAMWVCVHGISCLLITRSQMLLVDESNNSAEQAMRHVLQDPRATLELLIQSIRRRN
jgi:AcrR family transcriptional regulator